MREDSFLDTNVLVYALDSSEPVKGAKAREVIANGLRDGNVCISYQVVQETLNTVLRRFPSPMLESTLNEYLDAVLYPLWKVQPTPQLFGLASSVRNRYGFSFYDSLIVAAALRSECQVLLTEDLQHGQAIEGLRIVNPFL